MFYFGVKEAGRAGHYLYDNMFERNSRGVAFKATEAALGATIDGGYCPQKRDQGSAKLTHVVGLTILSFWDSTGDSRPGSNSNFIACGKFSYEQMIAMALVAFPSIMERLTFEIKVVEE